MKRLVLSSFAVLFVFAASHQVFAYLIPEQNSRARYFCVFGPQSSRLDGADKSERSQVIFFDVADTEPQELTIDIFDPDCGGSLDQKPQGQKLWQSIFEFAVYGQDDRLLQKERFADQPQFDKRFFRFGPFAKELGQPIGRAFRFKLVARPMSTSFLLASEDLNLFKVRVEPEGVESFAERVSFRLLEAKGSQMSFYVLIPAKASRIAVENYDLDPEGASAVIYDPAADKYFDIAYSESGDRTQTELEIGALDRPRRLGYIITKKSQRYGNAGLRVKDADGNPLPIYFSAAQEVAAAAPLAQKTSKKESAESPAGDGCAKMDAPQLALQPQIGGQRAAPPCEEKRKARVKECATPEIGQTKTAAVPKAVARVKPPVQRTPCNRFTFDATASHDPNNDALSFLWDFGDGQTSTKPVATHEYEKGGSYTVTLTVKDNSGLTCDSATTTQAIMVNVAPKPSFTAAEAVCVNEDAVFDASQTIDDTDQPLSYFWDFGDGSTAEGVQAVKRFAKGGTYTVRLTVDDNANTACSRASTEKRISVNTPPVARVGNNVMMCLSADKEYGVMFDGSKSSDADNDKLTYAWDFGDGTVAQGKKAIRVYKTGGSYTVKLTVDDGRGTGASRSEDTAQVVLNKQPRAVAGPDQASCPGRQIFFDGSGSTDADNDALAFIWDFGDGTGATGAQASHIYEKAGRYKIRLTVDDGRQTPCSIGQDGAEVYINESPVAILDDIGPACVNRAVAFDASQTRDDTPETLQFLWDFGDGTVTEGDKKMTHVFAKGGAYTVTVMVDDKKNTPCSTSMARVEVVVNTPPTAKPEPVFACCVDSDSIFDGSASSDADGNALEYSWDLGDGSTASGPRVVHRYRKGGVYTVTLTVDDGADAPCSKSSDSFKVRINESPVPVMKVK